MRSARYRILRSYKDTPHGPSGGIWTHGLMVPNHARYQLRYTRMCNTAIIRTFLRAVKSPPIVFFFFASLVPWFWVYTDFQLLSMYTINCSPDFICYLLVCFTLILQYKLYFILSYSSITEWSSQIFLDKMHILWYTKCNKSDAEDMEESSLGM